MFLLQKEENNNFLEVEYVLIKDLLNSSKQKYIEISKKDLFLLKPETFLEKYNDTAKKCIPIGTIEFTNEFFKFFYNIDKIYPIEVPNCLRTDEFLKRKYSIVSGENVPQSGRYFIKDVSNLKSFTYIGELSNFFNDSEEKTFDLPNIISENLYQVSEIIDIISEYRVYVLNNKVYAIAFYDGNPSIFPDVKIINKAIVTYSIEKDCPRSYTMDIAITKNGTCILEVHPFFSCGIYQTVLGNDFLDGYKDALTYVTKFNRLTEKFSNF